MKNLTLIEADDISTLTKLVGYFFEGDDGFLKKNGIAQYSFFLKDRPGDLLKLGKVLEGESASEDLYQLRMYICSELDRYRNEIVKHENSIKGCLQSIYLRKDSLELIKDCKTLKEAIILLLKTKDQNENTES